MRDSHRVLHALMLALLLALCLTGTALADEEDVPAYQVYDSLLDSSSSVQEFNARLLGDLAGRWFFADSAKRQSIPVVQKAYNGLIDGSLPKLLEDYDNNPSDAYTAFMFVTALYGVFEPLPLITQVYGLVTLDGGVPWDASSAGARDEFRAWYEYFEGASSGGSGGGGEVQGDYTLVPVTHTGFTGSGDLQCTHVAVPNAAYAEIVQKKAELVGQIVVLVNNPYYQSASSNVDILIIASTPGGFTYKQSNYSFQCQSMATKWIFTSIRRTDFVSSVEQNDGVFYFGANTTVNSGTWGAVTRDNGPVWFNNMDAGAGVVVGPGDPVYPTTPGFDLPGLPDLPNLPTINFPLTTQPTYEENATDTTTADLTPILRALRIINTNLKTGFEHFQDAVNDQFTALQGYLQTWFEWWKDFFTGWRDTWQEWERDFMRECNRANRWLERLYYKSGSGTSSRPDPSIKPTETVNWWDALAQKFLSMLPAAVQDIVSQLARLNGVFPFSIPWDVGAILGLFSQPAATPVFDLTIPNVNGTTWTARINLTQWNGVALVIRRCVLFSFAIQLMMWTPDVIKQLGVS